MVDIAQWSTQAISTEATSSWANPLVELSQFDSGQRGDLVFVCVNCMCVCVCLCVCLPFLFSRFNLCVHFFNFSNFHSWEPPLGKIAPPLDPSLRFTAPLLWTALRQTASPWTTEKCALFPPSSPPRPSHPDTPHGDRPHQDPQFAGPPKISRFFPLPPSFVCFFLFSGLSTGICVVFLSRFHLKFSGHHVQPWRPHHSRPPGPGRIKPVWPKSNWPKSNESVGLNRIGLSRARLVQQHPWMEQKELPPRSRFWNGPRRNLVTDLPREQPHLKT